MNPNYENQSSAETPATILESIEGTKQRTGTKKRKGAEPHEGTKKHKGIEKHQEAKEQEGAEQPEGAKKPAEAKVEGKTDAPTVKIKFQVEVRHEVTVCQGITEPGPHPDDGEDCYDQYHNTDETCDPMFTEISLADLEPIRIDEVVKELVSEHKHDYHAYEPFESNTTVIVVWDDPEVPDKCIGGLGDLVEVLYYLPIRGYAAKIIIEYFF